MWLLDILSDYAVQPTAVGCLRRLSTLKVMADKAITSFSTPINDEWGEVVIGSFVVDNGQLDHINLHISANHRQSHHGVNLSEFTAQDLTERCAH